MRVRSAIVMMSLLVGPASGGGVADARKLVTDSKSGELEVMKVLDQVTGDLAEEGVDKVLEWVLENGGRKERIRVGELMWSVPKSEGLKLSYVRAMGFYGEREQLESVIARLEKGAVHQEARYRLAALAAEDAERNLTLTDAERATRNREAVAILEELGKEEGLNDLLKKWIGELRYNVTHLVVGCEAPEIQGVDHEGKEFRLSEYRGKVVLLPFWGFW
jgi:uncharacterized protein (UPF0147 family)